MAFCRYQSLENIQPNVQWAVVPYPCAGITDSSTAALTFINIDTHSAGPHALPECMYIKTGQNRKDNLSLILEKLQLSHEGFPPAAFSRRSTAPGTSTSSGKLFFFQTYTGLLEGINRESVLLHLC